MTSVGVRELRQRASELLRLVEAGETIEVTDRGRPVALLSPIPELTGLELLRAMGEVEEASGEGLPEPIELPPGAKLPSEVLAELRRDER
jgi:prevent-host-death family protein